MLGTELTFSDGVLFQTFTVGIISDTIVEPVETILVNITDIIISVERIQISLTQQERNRIKISMNHARLSIYDACSK